MSFSSQPVAPEGYTKRPNARDVNVDLTLFPPFVKQLDVKFPEYEREGDIEYPFEETNGVGDENRIRGNWSSKADYLLSAIGFSVGIGNLWRFPVLVFEHGGLAFLVPYVTMLILAALPMLFLEATLGQFASLAAISVWKVVPLFKGIGIAMVLISCVLSIHLNIVSAWSLFYLFNSVSFSLPWSNCENSWSGLNCTLGTRITCTAMNGTLLVNGSCIVQTANSSVAVMRLYDEHTIPSLKYFHNDVLMLSSSIDEIGTLNWYLGICVLLSWIMVFLCLFQGVKSSGKVVYVIVVVPVIILAVLFARLFTLDGSPAAVLHFLKPKWNILQDLKVWGEAAVHAFYSVSCCTGGIITLSSYNRFHNRLFGDVAIIMGVDFLASIVCCLLTFSAIGFTCYEFSIDLDKFHIGDSVHLVFVFLAEALAGVPVAPLYTGLFFLFLFFIILSTQIIVVETIVTSLCDEFAERLRKNRRHVLTTVCASFILISLPFCLSAGFYWLLLLSKFTITWPLVVIAFLECMSISWVYGVDNLLDNIKWITGSYPPCYLFWKVLWKFVCPMVYLCILCFLWLDWQSVSYEDYHFPYWTTILGWGISLFPLLFVPITAVVQLCMAKGNLTQKWHHVLNPNDAWGPALAVHRAEYFPLQIPEARRLLLPPEVEIARTSAPALTEEEEAAQSESAVDQRSNRAVATSRSGVPTITSIPTFERETAI